MAEVENGRPPRDDLVRAMSRGYELRDAEEADAPPTLVGEFAVFDEWTEIDSIWEGTFMERIAAGAFKKTMREKRDSIKVLFNHGYDPQIGDKPLGRIEDLYENERGAHYEVPLLDAPYVRDELLPGLRADLYGASFRFRVHREEFEQEPDPSDHNPRGLPERTLKELELFEFGPVTFPAYASATAGVRSLTDQFYFDRLERHRERARELVTAAPVAPSKQTDAADSRTSVPERREPRFRNREEYLAWIRRI